MHIVGSRFSGYFEDDYGDYNSGYGAGYGMGSRGRANIRGRVPNSMMEDRGRGGNPGSHYVSKTGHSVHMRGLPFQANEQDVFDVCTLQPCFFRIMYGFVSFS